MASTSRNASRRGRRTSRVESESQVIETQPETQDVEIDHQVRTILNFLLCHSANKVPIKFTDLMPLAENKIEVLKRMPLVTQLLNDRYGIKLIQLEGTPKRYICTAECPPISIYELTESQRPQLTLLCIILTYIFLRGNRIEDKKLYNMLEMMQVDVHEEHAYFGDNIIKLIEETYVKQQYLARDRSQLSPYDEPKNFFSWGLRAKAEFTYQQTVQFASNLLNLDPSYFQPQLLLAEGKTNPEMLENLSTNNTSQGSNNMEESED